MSARLHQVTGWVATLQLLSTLPAHYGCIISQLWFHYYVTFDGFVSVLSYEMKLHAVYIKNFHLLIRTTQLAAVVINEHRLLLQHSMFTLMR